jgi:hypothetical protein
MPALSGSPVVESRDTSWYLGIDVGTIGISAVLLHASTGKHYPIYWLNEDSTEMEGGKAAPSCQKTFRLPALTYSSPTADRLFAQLPTNPIAVGALTAKLASRQSGIVLENFKPDLQLAIPHYDSQKQQWEPILQLLSGQEISLYGIRRALQTLLATLTPSCDRAPKVGAVGLDAETLAAALGQLAGVILGCPSAWGETYRVNLWEAAIDAGLVEQPEQIFCLEEAIAPILAGLSTPLPLKRGGTLAISLGATLTQIALVDLPEDLRSLRHSDFYLGSLPYGGNELDRDIFYHLLYPQLSTQQRQQLSLDPNLDVPQPGQPDSPKRDRAAANLARSPFGPALLKAAGYLKLILQHKTEFTLEMGSLHWTVQRRDLDAKVIQPFLEQLNRQLNERFIASGILEGAIAQVFLVGGGVGLETPKTWLSRKLPNATFIEAADSPTGEWLATGLACLPLYPQVVNYPQQQYSDYFLLLELLRSFAASPDRSYSLDEILQRLEHRGLNTSTCYERLVALINNRLPSGLVPPLGDDSKLSPTSRENRHYSDAIAEPIFIQEEHQQYRPNSRQQARLHRYLTLLLSGTHQRFEEPNFIKLRMNHS